MSIARISVRYAKPLLELAEEKKVLEQVKDDMINFSEICKKNREFVLMLQSPVITNLKKSAILKAIFGGRVAELTSMFFDIVTRKNREKFLPEIAEEFMVLYHAKKGNQEATVTTTVKLDGDMRKQFEKLVKEITGKNPILTEKVNPELIGGYVLQLGDQQVDESISGHLKDLKLKFQKETI